MSRLSWISQSFRNSQAYPDVEKEQQYMSYDYEGKTAELQSNLDRFRLMVGITTAASMQAWPTPAAARPRHGTAKVVSTPDGPGVLQSPVSSAMPGTAARDAGDAHSQVFSDGITSSAGPKRDVDVIHTPFRAAANRGIYEAVVSKAKRAGQMYKITALTINLCLGLQIVVAAALTALGAAGSVNGGGVTVLGAINTVIAGFLTYLKGTGLPGKEKYFQHEWQKIRDYIEARERDLRCHDNAFDIYDQVDYIRYMFDSVKKDVETNRSDRFIGTGTLSSAPDANDAHVMQQLQKKKLLELNKTMMTQLKDATQEAKAAASEVKAEISEKKPGHHFSDVFKTAHAQEEIKKAVHQGEDLAKTLENLWHKVHEDKSKGKGKDE